MWCGYGIDVNGGRCGYALVEDDVGVVVSVVVGMYVWMCWYGCECRCGYGYMCRCGCGVNGSGMCGCGMCGCRC